MNVVNVQMSLGIMDERSNTADNSDELCVVTQVIIASVVKRTNNVTKR